MLKGGITGDVVEIFYFPFHFLMFLYIPICLLVSLVEYIQRGYSRVCRRRGRGFVSFFFFCGLLFDVFFILISGCNLFVHGWLARTGLDTRDFIILTH